MLKSALQVLSVESLDHVEEQRIYSATGLESRKLFSFAKTIHLMCISILPSLDAVPYIITKLLHY